MLHAIALPTPHFPALNLNLAFTFTLQAVAVAIAVVTVNAFHKYAAAVEYTKEGDSRITRTFDAIIAVQDLIFAAKMWRPFRTLSDETATRTAIVNNMSNFQDLHRSMYAIAQGTHVEETYMRRIITSKVFDSADAGPTGVRLSHQHNHYRRIGRGSASAAFSKPQ